MLFWFVAQGQWTRQWSITGIFILSQECQSASNFWISSSFTHTQTQKYMCAHVYTQRLKAHWLSVFSFVVCFGVCTHAAFLCMLCAWWVLRPVERLPGRNSVSPLGRYLVWTNDTSVRWTARLHWPEDARDLWFIPKLKIARWLIFSELHPGNNNHSLIIVFIGASVLSKCAFQAIYYYYICSHWVHLIK